MGWWELGCFGASPCRYHRSRRLHRNLGRFATCPWQSPAARAVTARSEVSHYRVSVRSDSLPDDAVWSEPLSSGKFPVKQGKYREFHQFEELAERQLVQKPRIYKDFRAKFPARAEQGIVSCRSGNLTPDTGNLSGDQGNKDRASSYLTLLSALA